MGAEAPRPAGLSGPVLPQLARLAIPVLVVLMVQTLVGVAETYFVSALGTAPLAGVALVFPVSCPVIGRSGRVTGEPRR